MRVRLPILALTCALLCSASIAAAEPLGNHFEVTPMGGYVIFDPALLPTGQAPLRDAAYIGFRVGMHPRKWWGAELAAGTAPTNEDLPGPVTEDHGFIHTSGNLVLTPMGSRAGGPFLSAGWGFARITHTGNTNLDQGTLDLAAGVRYWMTDVVGVRLEARNIRWIRNTTSETGADYMMISAGLSVALGGTPRDTDGDGVPDKKDHCPDTQHGARVDANGCPLDSDGDKVFDGIDQCDNTPKGCVVNASGCPVDSDGDGVCDGVDTSPDTPRGATVDAAGTPKDSDGDGVLDGIDKCAGTAKGCKVDSLGCPTDADGDGVCDGIDKCPNTPADMKVDGNGCPVGFAERENEMFDTGMMRFQDIQFETGKAALLPSSNATLDVVGQILSQHPDLKVEVRGHTDSKGSDAANQALSAARADSVLAYIKRAYPNLKADQYTAKGMGESVPLVPNTTEANRAKNRRVEFVVLNKDVLRKEYELRKPQEAPRTQPAPPDSIRQSAPPDTTRR